MIRPDRLKEVPNPGSAWRQMGLGGPAPDAMYIHQSRDPAKSPHWAVQVWKLRHSELQGTPWEGSYRVSVRCSTATKPEQYDKKKFCPVVGWDDLQAIKEHLFPGQIAVEIYPPPSELVNVAHMRWLWVLPKGAVLPFNLNGKGKLES